jgi:ribosomal protein L37AE/L43A
MRSGYGQKGEMKWAHCPQCERETQMTRSDNDVFCCSQCQSKFRGHDLIAVHRAHTALQIAKHKALRS